MSNVGNVENVGNGNVGETTKSSRQFKPTAERRYNATSDKVWLLECILEERKKSEIAWELISVIVYSITVGVIAHINALYFKSDESTKYFVVILHGVYYAIKFSIMGIKLERDGLIHNKVNDIIILLPTIIGILLAVLLGVYILPSVITITFVNVGLEISKFIMKVKACNAM
ncbi:15558_t:CDS:2 [Funneliformis caledonium]|uniref:15558_t:CDS:1 n=1 Tax=Funneliformis caledonium TaxID=1117310 RepID=A0A9N9B5U8_9GLOM|nr:15558_t:CDS:2 [Funneliformis caledonium]